jgi:hypothetical protein
MRVLITKTNEILCIDGAQLKGMQIRLHRGRYTYRITYNREKNARQAFDNLLQKGYIVVDNLYEEARYGF